MAEIDGGNFAADEDTQSQARARDSIGGEATEFQAYGGPRRRQRICKALGLAIVGTGT